METTNEIFSQDFYVDQITILELAIEMAEQNIAALKDCPARPKDCDRTDGRWAHHTVTNRVVASAPTRRRALKKLKFVTDDNNTV